MTTRVPNAATLVVLFAALVVLSQIPWSAAAHAQDDTDSASPSSVRSGFGRSVAAIRDLNGDGLPEVLVGCPDSSAEGSTHKPGAVFVCPGADGALLLTIEGPQPQDDLDTVIAGSPALP